MAGGADPGGGRGSFFARHADQLLGKLLWLAVLAALGGASGWFLGNWLGVLVGAVIGVAMTALAFKLFRTGKAEHVEAPPPEPRLIQIVPQGGVSIEALRLPDGQDTLSWEEFEGGATRLLQQVGATNDTWRPDLVVGIRETGIFLADAITRHLWPARDERPPLGLAYHQGWAGHRTDISVALPPGFQAGAETLGSLRVLVVDFLFKTGSAIDSVARELERLGVSNDPDHLRLAVMFMCQLSRLPDPGAKGVRLTTEHFGSAETDCEPFERWLPRLSHIAGVGKLKLTPPWKSWAPGSR